jgi:ubiquitin C-terminal hydrolase
MGDSVKSLTQLFDEIRSKSKDLKFQSHSPHCPPLVNIYNTCFVNVVLQALFHTVPLTSFLLEQNHGSASSNTNFDYFKELQAHLHEENVMVLLHFIDMIQTFCSSSGVNSVNGVNSGNGVNGNGHSTRTPVKPLAFIRELRTSLPSYEWGKQHDAQELLIWLLNCFHDCLSKLVIHKIEGEPTCKLDQMRVDATIQWVKNYFKPPKSEKGNIESNYAINAKESTDGNEGNDTKFLSHYSQILRIFGGQSLERINCENCNFINYKYESFLSSELTIPENSRNIQDLLSHQCALERLDCENEWTCDQCHTKNQPYRRMTYWQLPEILVLSMKRFSVERIGHNFYHRI